MATLTSLRRYAAHVGAVRPRARAAARARRIRARLRTSHRARDGPEQSPSPLGAEAKFQAAVRAHAVITGEDPLETKRGLQGSPRTEERL